MPFDVGSTINYMADAFLRAPAVNSIARNPIYTALLITFVTMLIIMFIFRDADTDDSLLVMCLRGGFWIFLMMLGTLFLHNKILSSEVSAAETNNTYNDVFNGGYSSFGPKSVILEDSIIPVRIDTDFTK